MKKSIMTTLQTGIFLSLLLSLTSVHAEVSPETMVDVLKRLETLETKARELTGENEVLKHQIGELKKSQKEGFLNIDERIEGIKSAEPTSDTPPKKEDKVEVSDNPDVKIVDPSMDVKTKIKLAEPEKSEKKADVAAAAAAEATSKPVAKKKSRAPNSYEKETYKAAFSLMKTSPSAATKAFKEYIKMQPESPLAANAQYWIGEIMYSHNNYKGAVQEFIKVLQKYKYSDKAPDAAIKLGYSFYALKNWTYARRTFDDVIKYFPENKNAVGLATRRLAKIKALGH